MKIIDLLNKIANETLEDGFKFKYAETTYRYNKNSGEIKKIEDDYMNFGDMWRIEECLNEEVEVIEENKEIEELDNMELINARPEVNAIKINELVRAVNKLNKEREEQ